MSPLGTVKQDDLSKRAVTHGDVTALSVTLLLPKLFSSTQCAHPSTRRNHFIFSVSVCGRSLPSVSGLALSLELIRFADMQSCGDFVPGWTPSQTPPERVLGLTDVQSLVSVLLRTERRLLSLMFVLLDCFI